jgi:hypothetical protein
MRRTILLTATLLLFTRSASAQEIAPVDVTPPVDDSHRCEGGVCRSCTTSSCSRSCSRCSSCGSSCSTCRHSLLLGGETCGEARPAVRFGIIGVRGSVTHVDSERGGTSAMGVAFAGSADAHALDGAARTEVQWVLGGGEAGFDGLFAGALDIGYRFDVTDRQGPFVRAGIDGRVQKNDALRLSFVELPRLTLGWQYLDGRTVLEGGLRGGTILTGRYQPGDEGRRRLNGPFEYGLFASLSVDAVKFEATVMRLDGRKSGNREPIDFARGSLCGKVDRLGICADAMAIRGDVERGTPTVNRRVTSAYGGLSVGFAF